MQKPVDFYPILFVLSYPEQQRKENCAIAINLSMNMLPHLIYFSDSQMHLVQLIKGGALLHDFPIDTADIEI